jgi:endo-1,4-beta-xylanase
MSKFKPLVRRTTVAAALLFAAAGATAQTAQGPSLRQTAGGHPLIGCAAMAYQLDNPKLANLIAAQFDCITAENELKPEPTEPSPGQFNFEAGDKLLAFAKAHDMKLIGHNLCWHSQSPRWMFQDDSGKPLSRELALANLKRHIDGVAGHYKGQVLGWDVVNEAISDNPNEYLRDTPAKKAIGDDFIEQAFKFAAAADPGAELYYNDYNDENPGKRENTIRLIKDLKSKGCRIDGVGVQGHWMMIYPNAPEMLEQAIEQFSSLGVKVSITELDLEVLPRNNSGANVSDTQASGMNPYPDALPKEIADKQADFYKRVFAVINKHRDVVERVTFWGTHDGTSWLNDWPVRGRTNHALLWDRNLNPKPAFFAVIDELQAKH